MIFNGQLDIYTKRNSKSQSECHEERSKGIIHKPRGQLRGEGEGRSQMTIL